MVPNQPTNQVAVPQTPRTSANDHANPNPNFKRFCTFCGSEMSIGRDGKYFCAKCGYKPEASGGSSQAGQAGKSGGMSKDTRNLIIKIIVWLAVCGVALYMAKMMLHMFISIM